MRQLKIGIITRSSFNQSLASYHGFLKHANSFKLTKKLKDQILGMDFKQ